MTRSSPESFSSKGISAHAVAERSTDSTCSARSGSSSREASAESSEREQGGAAGLADRFRRVRDATEAIAAPLSPEDCLAQSMSEASPVKWHLAHTSWFFETFILQPHDPAYQPSVERSGYLFNSYYNAVGERIDRSERGLMTRPSLEEVRRFRDHVDQSLLRWLTRLDQESFERFAPLIELGLHHEQQHQELMLTDVKHLFSMNPLDPVYEPRSSRSPASQASAESGASGAAPWRWIAFDAGVRRIGVEEGADGFAFDNESPRHRRFLEAFELADRPITCGEFLAFIEDGGYQRHELWLDLGWATVQQEGWTAPLYWSFDPGAGQWTQFTLHGREPIDPLSPVTHVSFFEADAFARWWGARLPTEAEWELACASASVDAGRFLESGVKHPKPTPDPTHRCASARPDAERAPKSQRTPGDDEEPALQQAFGDVWEWTRSSYEPYPGYTPTAGALGEYNGKFMCNQYVLRGGSCATPRDHIRLTYRNFFPPQTRWQFSGVRLARARDRS